MKGIRVIGILLSAAMLVSCAANPETVSEDTTEKRPVIIETTTEVAETETTPAELVPFEFNAHVYSATISQRIPQEYWESFYNLCDALRAGETTFKCSSQDAYDWCTDVGVLCSYFPAAGTRVEGRSDDGSPAFENGTGKIHYNLPVDEYVARQADFETLVVDIINCNVESDDTEYEKALKLYLYMALNYEYKEDIDYDDNYVYHTFTTKKGVCGNFAAVYSYLLLQVGIDAVHVGCFEEDMCHAWTYAVIDGKGYYFDPTWALGYSINGIDYIYLDYFMMSSEERNSDGCLVYNLTADVVPEFWLNQAALTLPATDSSYNLRDFCTFVRLDEDEKIMYYTDMSDNLREFYYGV